MSALSEPLESWQELAACRDQPVDLFFPDSYHHGVPEHAAALCERCEVHTECLDHALRHETEGIWAGTTPERRHKIRRAAGIRLTPLGELPPPQRIFELHRLGATNNNIAEALDMTVDAVEHILRRSGRHANRERTP